MKRELREEVQRTQEHQEEARKGKSININSKKQVQTIALSAGLATIGGIGLFFLGKQLIETAQNKPEKTPQVQEKQRKAAKWIKDKFRQVKQDKVRVIKVQ